MATGVNVWSKTASSNNTADSAVNWQEGQAPSSVNDSARGMMAATAKWRDDLNGTVATSGTSTAYTATSNQSFAALSAGIEITCQFDEDCGATVTLNVDSLGAKPLRSAAGVELVAGAIKAGSIHRMTYATSNSGEWLLHDVNPTIIAADQVVTASIVDAAVTLAKMANLDAGEFIGRHTASTGVPETMTFGAGLSLDASTGEVTAPAFPPVGAFRNLVIKVATNTTVTVAADAIALDDGTNSRTVRSVSHTVNLASTGANALDTGSIASGTWYAIWEIAKDDGTKAALASTSFSSPTMPTDYTYKARIGAVRTSGSSAQLKGSWQFGRKARFILGLAQTTGNLPTMITGVSGNISTPGWTAVDTSAFVPTTASMISVGLHGNLTNCAVAPNQNYAGLTDSSNAAWGNGGSGFVGMGMFELMLESTNIYYVSNSAANYLQCYGWEDNL